MDRADVIILGGGLLEPPLSIFVEVQQTVRDGRYSGDEIALL